MTSVSSSAGLDLLRPDDISALCRYLQLPTPTPDVPLAIIIANASLTPEAIYALLKDTTDIRLMIAAHALRNGIKKLPPDPRLNPAPMPPAGGQRTPLKSGELVPLPSYSKTETVINPAAPIPTRITRDMIVTYVGPNTKQPRSAVFQRYKGYAVGITVEQALAAGVRIGDVRWDVDRGFITLAAKV